LHVNGDDDDDDDDDADDNNNNVDWLEPEYDDDDEI
jgi:hypothetical protein